ncbi:MAG: long-chain fatty acid--CoA ligase [Gallionella sp.]|nr:long-chain fatty acid--CoA ligase [Gallionella sp.]
MQTNNVITPQQSGTLHGLFLERVARSPDKIAYRYFMQDAWCELTWREVHNQVARWQSALVKQGLQRGDRVAIMLRNCPQWVMFDQAAMSLGLVVVPLYIVDRPDNIAFIVNNADIKVLLLETAEQWQSLCTVGDQLANVQCFVSIDNVPNNGDARLHSMADFLPDTAQLQTAPPCEIGELASIIYTSGTTGKPKGVMLSHGNMLSNAYATLEIFTVREEDVFISFLPLSHTFERTLGYYLTVMTGSVVAFARSIPQLSDDLQIIRPTLMISVPRIYERVYGAIHTKLDEGSPLKRKLFKLAVDVGWARFEEQQGRRGWKLSFLLWPILKKLVAQKIMDKLGGNLRAAFSGGAALAPEISRLFIGLGLPIIQGYGLTETSPVITGNHEDNNFPDSAGLPIPDVQVRLGERNELQVKGPNVMLGYWNNPEATQAMIDADGWLSTGDIARISETGHVYITGRIKEIIVMSNGEKIPPNDMELAILQDKLFDQAMIFGEARPYLVALVVLNPDVWSQFCDEVGIKVGEAQALSDPQVQAKILERITLNLRSFPGYAKVNRVLLLQEPWSIDNGLLTPTLKLKRPHVVSRYEQQIKQLYAGH